MTKREQILLSIALTLLCTGLLYQYGYLPWQQKSQDLDQQILRAQENHLVEQEITTNRTLISGLNSETGKLIPETLALPEFIQVLSALAEAHQVQLIGLKLDHRELETTVQTNTLRLQANGLTENILGFIQQLENNERLVRVDEIRIFRKFEGKTADTIRNAEILLTIFVAP